MKLSLVFLAVLGVATAASIPSSNVATKGLAEDLDDFVALLDLDKMLEVSIRYLSEDEEVQTLLVWLSSEECKNLVEEVNEIPEYIATLEYLHNAGLDVYKWVKIINDLLGLSNYPTAPYSRVASTRGSTNGVAGWIDELSALIPREALRALHEEKLVSSEAYADLVKYLAADEFQSLCDQLRAHPAYQTLKAGLEAHGLPVDEIIKLGNELIGLA